MDEPLSNLDAKMRVHTRSDIARLQANLGVTTVYVTHDQVEAMTMGDRVAVMDDGILQQVDTPLSLYDRPANLFVASFIGSPQMNLIEAKANGGQATIGDYSVPVDPAAAQKMHGDITIGVRPEAWRVVGNSEDGLPVRVDVVEDLGADAFVYGTGVIGGTSRSITIRASGRNHPNKGEMMYITTDPRNLHVFDTATGSRLSD
jgi:multiple sugar transport system ATP-binding protein